MKSFLSGFFSAGYEKQESSTIDFMVNNAIALLNAARQNAGKTAVVLTSSTGSTNPPGAAADALKNEPDFWSDPEAQKSKGKFSPAAKTLMEIEALKFVGRNQRNEVVDQSAAERTKNVRVCIMNPSWILGPQLQPGDITGNGLPWFAKIAKGESMKEQGCNSIRLKMITKITMKIILKKLQQKSRFQLFIHISISNWTFVRFLSLLNGNLGPQRLHEHHPRARPGAPPHRLHGERVRVRAVLWGEPLLGVGGHLEGAAGKLFQNP